MKWSTSGTSTDPTGSRCGIGLSVIRPSLLGQVVPFPTRLPGVRDLVDHDGEQEDDDEYETFHACVACPSSGLKSVGRPRREAPFIARFRDSLRGPLIAPPVGSSFRGSQVVEKPLHERAMPNIKSAKKRMNLSAQARTKNRAERARIRTAIKRVRVKPPRPEDGDDAAPRAP